MLLLFITAYVAAALGGVLLLYRSVVRRVAPWRLSAPFFALVVVQIGCTLWGLCIEPYWLEFTEVHIKGPRPLRILHLSDLHLKRYGPTQPHLQRILNHLHKAPRPDVIVMTGDYLSEEYPAHNLAIFVSELQRYAQVYAVIGNWDHDGAAMHAVESGGAIIMDNTVVPRADLGVALIAPPAQAPGQVAELMAKAPPELYRIVLHHYPDAIEPAAASGANLVLCGHTHGGQVRLPFYGALVTMSRTGKRFEAGLYQVGETAAYTSRGVGFGGPVPLPVRFMCRPEVTFIELGRDY